MSIVLIT